MRSRTITTRAGGTVAVLTRPRPYTRQCRDACGSAKLAMGRKALLRMPWGRA